VAEVGPYAVRTHNYERAADNAKTSGKYNIFSLKGNASPKFLFLETFIQFYLFYVWPHLTIDYPKSNGEMVLRGPALNWLKGSRLIVIVPYYAPLG
jgi:hypothetical protein